jgi:hypothetical protein
MADDRVAQLVRLERLMVELDRLGDPLADELRDIMDSIWYELTDEEQARFGRRQVPRAKTPASSLHRRRLAEVHPSLVDVAAV